MSGFLFDGRSKDQKIQEAKKLLQDNGYLVQGPFENKQTVDSVQKLVKFFYETMSRYSGNRKMSYGGSPTRDRKLAKDFLQSRIDTGISKEVAYYQCCELIEFLFKHEQHLGLKFPVTSMAVLGQGEGFAWLTERLV